MSLKQHAVNSVKWTSASTVIVTVLQFVQIVVLTKILDPSVFGLMAILTVIIGLCQIFSDMGLSNAIIYRQDVEREHLSSLYWLNVAAGLAIFLAIVIVTPFIAAFYQEPRLTGLMLWAGLIFFVISAGQQFQILMQKELAFNRLAMIEVIATVAGVVCTIALALSGSGIMSLVLGQLIIAIARTGQLILARWRDWHPQLRFRMSDLDGYLGFGLYQMGERILNYFSSNVDVIIIGKFLGPDILGYYSLAYHIIVMPLLKINPVITRVAFPVFAKQQNENALLRWGYLQIIKFLSFVSLPILTGVAVTAPLFVPVVLGANWMPSVPLIQILSVVGIIKTLLNPSGTVYLAKGMARLGFLFNLFGFVFMLATFLVTVRYGIIVFALSYVLENLVIFIALQSIVGKIVELKWGEYLRSIYKQILISLGMGAVVYMLYILMSSLALDAASMLALEIVAGVSCYLSLSVIFSSGYLRELWQLLGLPRNIRARFLQYDSQR